MTGELNVAALERSLNEIVRRHEILRTTFDVVDGQPVQIVSPSLHVPLVVVDLAGAAGTQSRPRSRRRCKKRKRRWT